MTLVITAVSACASSGEKGPRFDVNYQEPRLDLDRYKSVQLREHQCPELVVVAAISGGGHRAANYAAGVFAGLERLVCPDSGHSMLSEIDYFSTVSGGGIAVGAYLYSLHDSLRRTWPREEPSPSRQAFSFRELLAKNAGQPPSRLRRRLRTDFHTSLVLALLTNPTLGMVDRGDLFEEQLDDEILGRSIRWQRSLRLSDVFKPRDGNEIPILPYWIPNSTVWTNGFIFPHTPDMYERYGIAKYTHRMEQQWVGPDPLDYFEIPLAVGLKASASFPGVFPATTLESSWEAARRRKDKNTFVHLGDGGLADNLGLVTALRVLRAEMENRRGGGRHPSDPGREMTARRSERESEPTPGGGPARSGGRGWPLGPGQRYVLLIIDVHNGETSPFDPGEGALTIPEDGIRSALIGLDSRHARYLDILEECWYGDPQEAPYLDGMIRGGRTWDGIEVVLLGVDLLPPRRREAAQGVSTSLDLGASSQKLLISSGKETVKVQDEILRRVLGLPEVGE